jgi:hypothetical protein
LLFDFRDDPVEFAFDELETIDWSAIPHPKHNKIREASSRHHSSPWNVVVASLHNLLRIEIDRVSPFGDDPTLILEILTRLTLKLRTIRPILLALGFFIYDFKFFLFRY